MIKYIAKKEVMELLRDGRVITLAVMLLILTVGSSITSYYYHEDLAMQHQSAAADQRELWEKQGAKNPHSAAHYGVFAFKPVSPLSILEKGLNPYTGVSIFLEAHMQNHAEFKGIEDSNTLARFGELNPSFLLLFLVPLFIILLAFNTYTREREAGTLKILLSQGIGLKSIWAGKLMGIWSIVLLFILPLLMIMFLFLLLSENTVSQDYTRFFWIILLLLVYYATFIHLSVWVSSKVTRSYAALIILLGLWIVSTLLMPRVTTHIAKTLYPIPSEKEFNEKLRFDLANGVDGHDPYNEFSVAYREKLLKEYGVDKAEDLPFNLSGHMLQVGEEHEAVIYDKHFNALAEIHNNQLKVYAASSVLSPTLLGRLFFMSMAQTDLYTHQDFSQEAERYRLALMRELNKDIELNAPIGQAYVAEASLFASNIQFDYTTPALEETWTQAWPFAVYLIFWALLSLMVSRQAALKVNPLS